MIRDALLAVLGPAIILFVAALVMMHIMPAHGAEGCVAASWYGPESGNRTADGSYFDGTQMIAASRTLPMGTKLRVSLGRRSVIVTVRDRGPAKWTRRDLDLSRSAASKLGMIAAGVACVVVERLR